MAFLKDRRLYPIWRLLFVAAIAAGWELIAINHVFNTVAVATPVSVVKIMWRWFAHGSVSPAVGTIWESIGNTMFIFAMGYVSGVVAGILVGTLLGTSAWFRAYFSPFMVFFNATPRLALIPFLIAWLGFVLCRRSSLCSSRSRS